MAATGPPFIKPIGRDPAQIIQMSASISHCWECISHYHPSTGVDGASVGCLGQRGICLLRSTRSKVGCLPTMPNMKEHRLKLAEKLESMPNFLSSSWLYPSCSRRAWPLSDGHACCSTSSLIVFMPSSGILIGLASFGSLPGATPFANDNIAHDVRCSSHVLTCSHIQAKLQSNISELPRLGPVSGAAGLACTGVAQLRIAFVGGKRICTFSDKYPHLSVCM
jgi:hypothetical protein